MYQNTGNYKLNRDILEGFLQKYGEVAGIYVAAYECSGKMITEFSLKQDEKESIDSLFPEESRQLILQRVVDNEIEDQAVEDHAIPGIRIAASATKKDGRVSDVWLFFGVIESEFDLSAVPEEYRDSVQALKRRTSISSFLKAMDVLHAIGMENLRIRNAMVEWESEKRENTSATREMSENLQRLQITTEILQYLDSDKSIDYIMQEFLNLTGRFLQVESNYIVKTRQKENTILAKWNADEENRQLDFDLVHGHPMFLEGKKPFVVSFDSSFMRRMEDEQADLPYKALMSIPIELNRQTDMYVCFFETKEERIWGMEEVQFIKDMIRVLQNIMEKRIQKNSLASSYASLEEILENVGCAILVCNTDDGEVYFSNQRTNSMFPKREDGSSFFKEIVKITQDKDKAEIFDRRRKKWFEVHRKQIRWVDGQEKDLFSIFDITEKKEYQQKIEQQAYTDFLTGLYNRLCCERDLARTVDDAKNMKKSGALLYLDLDDFKHINDGLGHHYGDVLLKNISTEIRKVRGIEEACYRVGGDEFIIIVSPDYFSECDRIIEDIKTIFSKPWLLKDGVYYCTMSMGTVTFPEEGDSISDLICKADIAMYEAKRNGKNRVEKYNHATLPDSTKRLNMEKNMRNAAKDGYKEFQIYYQPIIDIQQEGTPCVGAEALIRWDSVELGFVCPGDFIPLAEYLGLINPIGNHVLIEACKSCKFWNDNGHPEYKVNVNLSVVQLLQNDIAEIVEQIISDTGINPRNLTLEVTESLAINDMPRMCAIMKKIRQLGVRIALDDFGTGYSSLNHIREIPLDVIKVDQSFVTDLVEDDYSQSFVKMVAELAGAIGVSICVEGIEHYEQYKVLENMNVRLVQGFYFDRPMPKDQFEAKYVLNQKTVKNVKKINKK